MEFQASWKSYLHSIFGVFKSSGRSVACPSQQSAGGQSAHRMFGRIGRLGIGWLAAVPAINEPSIERSFPQPNLKMRVFDLYKAEGTLVLERIAFKRSIYSRLGTRREPVTSFEAPLAHNCENRDRHLNRPETLVRQSVRQNA